MLSPHRAGNGLPPESTLTTLDFYILAGDANRDRAVNAADLGVLSLNWQGTNKTYQQGDFNLDGTVDIRDLLILTTNWQAQVPQPVALFRTPLRSARSARLVSVVG